jgi:hypothetical protein
MPNLDSGTERHCAAIGPADLQAVPTSRQHAIEEIRAAKLGVRRPQPAGVRVGGRDWAGPAWILVDQIKLILHRALLDNDAPKLRGREPAPGHEMCPRVRGKGRGSGKPRIATPHFSLSAQSGTDPMMRRQD